MKLMGRAAEDKGRDRPQGRETPPLSRNKKIRVCGPGIRSRGGRSV